MTQNATPAAEWASAADLRPWDRNPRKNDEAAKDVARSIVAYGFGAPIVARRGGDVIAGHTRLKAVALLPAMWKRAKPADRETWSPDSRNLATAEKPLVPVRYLDVTEQQARALNLADNRLGEKAEWNDDALAAILREMDAEGEDLGPLGWSDEELKRLIGAPGGGAGGGDGDDDKPPIPVPPEPVSKLGEVYQFGPHRLVCGDSTDPATWDRLLGSEQLDMVWTDPPYGVAVNNVSSIEQAKTLKRRIDGLLVENDDLDETGLESLLSAALGFALTHSKPGAPWYVAAPPGPLHHVFGGVLRALGVWRQTLVWVKDVFVLGRSEYHYRHEPIFFGWKPGAAHYTCGRRDMDTVFEVSRPKASHEHPTMKPVALVAGHVEHSSPPGGIVGDPFGGSGTTLIAAAASGRTARLIELSPGYCDVIRRRWGRWCRDNGHDPGPEALRPELVVE